jgi:hypothetical protein
MTTEPPRISGVHSSRWNPNRRGEPDFDQCSEAHDDQAKKQDDKNRWAISGVLGREVEAANLAHFAHLQQPGEQSAPAAPRTAAAERCPKGRNGGESTRLIHPQKAG